MSDAKPQANWRRYASQPAPAALQTSLFFLFDIQIRTNCIELYIFFVSGRRL